MKIISWNMGCGPTRARYRKAHAEAWSHLLHTLQPDVAFLQEALLSHPVTAEQGTVIWSDAVGTDTGTAVFIRRGVAFEREHLRSEGSYVAAVSIVHEGMPTLFVSIHVGPPNYRKHLKVLAETLGGATAGRRF